MTEAQRKNFTQSSGTEVASAFMKKETLFLALRRGTNNLRVSFRRGAKIAEEILDTGLR